MALHYEREDTIAAWGVRVVTTWMDGQTTARHTVSRVSDGAKLLTKDCTPFDLTDLGGRHWSFCENIRHGLLVVGDDPASEDGEADGTAGDTADDATDDAVDEEAHHDAA